MSVLRIAEKTLMDLVIQLHWIAREVADPAVAHRLRNIADALNDQAIALRVLWEPGVAG